MIVVADAGPIHYLVLVLGSPLSSARRTTALFRLIGTCLPPSSVAFPPNDRRKLAPDPTKERVAEDSDAEHCGHPFFRGVGREFAAIIRKNGWPKIPMQSTAANSAIASKLRPPSRSQYTSRRLSHSANSSNVSAAPTP